MSNIRLHSVLNLSVETWYNTEVDNMLRRARYIEASRLIKKQEAEIEKLKATIGKLEAKQ